MALRGRLRAAKGCPGGDALVERLLAARGGAPGVGGRGAACRGDLAVAALCLWWQAIGRAGVG